MLFTGTRTVPYLRVITQILKAGTVPIMKCYSYVGLLMNGTFEKRKQLD